MNGDRATDRGTMMWMDMVELSGFSSGIASVCRLMDNLVDDCEKGFADRTMGMDEEVEELRYIFGRLKRLYDGTNDKMTELAKMIRQDGEE